MNLKLGSVHHWEQLGSLFNTKFFCAEAKFMLAELGRTRQYSREDLDVYMKRFCEKALDCCVPIAKDIFLEVCLHRIEDY